MEKLVFIVDDDLFYQEFMQGHMKNLGYEVSSFSNGQSCLDQLHQKPDLIILDHQLGEEENGLDVLRKIKLVNPKIPVIYLSAQNDLATAEQALKFGSFDYIEKNTSAYVRLRTTLDRIHESKKSRIFNKLNSFFSRF
jgi:DNA-binding NtrC family response regulator